MQRRGRGGAFEGARQMHYSRFQEISRVFEPLYKQEVSEVTIPLYSRVADFQRSLTRYRRALKKRKKKKGKVPVARKWLVTKASEEIGKIITISFSRFATLRCQQYPFILIFSYIVHRFKNPEQDWGTKSERLIGRKKEKIEFLVIE